MSTKRGPAYLLVVIYLGFISLGLPDGSFGLAWPAIYPELGLPIGLAGTIICLGTLLSGSSGFMSGRVISRFGTGRVVLISCVLTGGGLMVIGLAQAGYVLFLCCIPLGIGAGAVDSGLNSYVARHYSGRHMNWLHACWGIGATAGPLLVGYFIGSAGGWRAGYVTLGGIQLGLAILFFMSLRLWSLVPEKAAANDEVAGVLAPKAGANSIAGWLSMLAFVLYVGVETMTGLWIGSILIVGQGFSPSLASLCTAAYFGAITGGRILAGFVVDSVGNRRLISAGMLMALVGALLFALAQGPVMVMAALLLIGLGFAPVYPGLMHEVPRRFVAEDVSIVIGRQTGASYIGAAAMPLLGGWFAQYAMQTLPYLTLMGAALLFACVKALDARTPLPKRQ